MLCAVVARVGQRFVVGGAALLLIENRAQRHRAGAMIALNASRLVHEPGIFTSRQSTGAQRCRGRGRPGSPEWRRCGLLIVIDRSATEPRPSGRAYCVLARENSPDRKVGVEKTGHPPNPGPRSGPAIDE